MLFRADQEKNASAAFIERACNGTKRFVAEAQAAADAALSHGAVFGFCMQNFADGSRGQESCAERFIGLERVGNF